MLLKHLSNLDVEDEFVIIDKNETIYEVAKKLQQGEECDINSTELMCNRILAAYIVEDEVPIGVITEKDIISEIILKNKDPKKIVAKDIMQPPVCCNMNDTSIDAINLILDNGLLTLAVCDGKKLISVLSVYDAMYLMENVEIL